MRRRRDRSKELEPEDLSPEHFLYGDHYNIGKRQMDEIDIINQYRFKVGDVYTNEAGEQRRITMIKVPAGANMFYSTDMRHLGVPVFVTPASGYPECKIAYAPYPGGPLAVQKQCDPSEFVEWIGNPEGAYLDDEAGWPSFTHKNHGEGYVAKLDAAAEKMMAKSAEGLKGKAIWAPLPASDSISEGAAEANKEVKTAQKSGKIPGKKSKERR